MAHKKVYAFCENLCKEETMTKGQILQNIRGTVLYNNPNGSNANSINLEDEIENYDYIEIYYGRNTKHMLSYWKGSTEFKLNDSVCANLEWTSQDPGTIVWNSSTWQLKNDVLTRESETVYNKYTGTISSSTDTYIFKVIGYVYA